MAAAAEPTQASTIWAAHCSTDLISSNAGAIKRRKLSTTVKDLDTALAGGLEYGSITCISADTDSGVEELALALTASHLLSDDKITATVIDTTLAFDLRKLHHRLTEALKVDGDDVTKAMAALDRLQIMKVFDFIGLTESVTEIRGRYESGTGVASESHAPPKATISDSEDEDEMLDDEPPARLATPHKTIGDTSSVPRPGLLIINNITQVAAPLLKGNHAQGQALLSSFMRSLSHLTKTHSFCTILLNGTTTHTQAKDESPSIFSSCLSQPALGKTFTYSLDVHLLMHSVPRTAEDAKVVYGSTRNVRDERKAELVSVVEVLQDRYGERAGRWAAFDVATDGRLTSIL